MRVFYFQKFPGHGLATKSNAATLAELQSSWNRERSLDGAVTHPQHRTTATSELPALPAMRAILILALLGA